MSHFCEWCGKKLKDDEVCFTYRTFYVNTEAEYTTRSVECPECCATATDYLIKKYL